MYRDLVILWSFKKLVDTLFSNVNIERVADQFLVSSNHILAFIGNFIFIILLMMTNRKEVFANAGNGYVKALIGYYFFLMMSSWWSELPIISLGNAFYLYVNLFFGLALGSKLNKNNEPISCRFEKFLGAWVAILVIEFISAAMIYPSELPFVTFGERSLLGFIVFYLWIQYLKKIKHGWLLLYMLLAGRSLSALFCASCFYVLEKLKDSKKYAVSIFLVLGVAALLLFQMVAEGEITIYGKNIDHILTGSGRFQAWTTVIDAYMESDFMNLILGHGYASERPAMVSANLIWAVDVHNNIIQSIYGVGILGLLVMLYVFIYPYKYLAIYPPKFVQKSTLQNINLVLFSFGMTSSTYLSKPDVSIVFFVSIFVLTLNHENFS